MKRLQKDLGPSDRNRLNAYLDDVREIERRIQRIEKYNSSGEARRCRPLRSACRIPTKSTCKLMFDLQALAFMTDDHARLGLQDEPRRERPRLAGKRRQDAVPSVLASRRELRRKIAEFAKLNRYHVSLIPYFLEKLKNTPDGDGNLLDHSMVLYGSPMGDSNVHNHKRVPLFLAGPRQRQAQGQSARAVPDGTPMANVLLTMLHKLGVNVESFGDSNGEIAI